MTPEIRPGIQPLAKPALFGNSRPAAAVVRKVIHRSGRDPARNAESLFDNSIMDRGRAGAHGVATPTHCDKEIDVDNNRMGDGAHGVATPTHCDSVSLFIAILLHLAHTAWPRRLIEQVINGKPFPAHTAWPRRLIATSPRLHPAASRPAAHTAWPRQLIATCTGTPSNTTYLRRTRRGHADSLRLPEGAPQPAVVHGAHGVATPTHCDA